MKFNTKNISHFTGFFDQRVFFCQIIQTAGSIVELFFMDKVETSVVASTFFTLGRMVAVSDFRLEEDAVEPTNSEIHIYYIINS